MNKTVNINLAGIFFHIDEDAYIKLQHYLDAIKRSFANTTGYDEIIADIEARIAELFQEKMKTDRQVISSKEVEEVIAIMGQPEDYIVDEDLFEDQKYSETSRSTGKQLFRDTDHAYIGGVSSGLGHYLGIDPIWMRLLWILLTIGSSGAFILIYIALWIFVPEAKTTADKLAMRGEPVNISNIERKIKEGFDDVSGKVKSIDYGKYGYRAKSGASSAATAVGNVVSFLLNVFVKFIGILLLLIAGTTLIALFIGLFTVGTFGIIDAPWTDYIKLSTGTASIWIISILSFFAIGIPFFFLFILGLKILVENLKSIGRTAKLVLLGLWIISVLGLIFFGIKQATETAIDGEVVITESLPVTAYDTLYLKMKANPNFQSLPFRSGDYEVKYNENDQKVLFSSDIQLIVRTTADSLARIEIIKSAEGKNYEDARQTAQEIIFTTAFENNELLINSYLTTNVANKYRDQEVQVLLYMPIGSVLHAAQNTSSFHRNSDYYDDILNNGDEEKFLLITGSSAECIDCPEENEWETDEGLDEIDNNDVESRTRNQDSFDINGAEVKVKIDEEGVQVENNQEEVLRIRNSSN